MANVWWDRNLSSSSTVILTSEPRDPARWWGSLNTIYNLAAKVLTQITTKMEKKSQTEQIRQHLDAEKTIIRLKVLNKFRCQRLWARIHHLKAMGLAIHATLVGDNGKHYAVYSMVFILAIFISSCATQSPKSVALHRAVEQFQECAQYQARRSSGQDPGRIYRNYDRRPHLMTRVPFTNIYIF